MLILFALQLAAAPRCSAATGDAQATLRRAAAAIGLPAVSERVLRVKLTDITQHDFESDRPYPPYLMQATRIDEWYDPATGADRLTTGESMIGTYDFSGGTTLGTRDASYSVRDTSLVPSAELHTALASTRPLNAWAMLSDWSASPDVRVVERCDYRGYPRLVLTRAGLYGEERLYIDPKSGIPVALMRQEPHYLWGQRQVEYVYATWSRVGPARVPGVVTRVVDGGAEVTRAFGEVRLVPRDSAPRMAIPATHGPMPVTTAAFLAPRTPDTVRVSATTFLLKNVGYAEAVTLAHDTVFVFDATQGEQRAHADSVWIGKLFPGRHPIVVVVTDLAWPHVAGVRYWVAAGATIASHRSSETFLKEVVARRWTASPDALEKRRSRTHLRFLPVDSLLTLGQGEITLFAIDGVGSEGALASYVRGDRFLWASDFIQTVTDPSEYLDEVVAATKRVHVEPVQVAAEHLPLTPWERVLPLASASGTP